MENEVDIFKPGIAELTAMADKYKGLSINGIEDKNGYDAAKKARKELGDMRIAITKTGKAAREDARKYAQRVIDQEKEYLSVIVPTEDDLKEKIEAIDDAKKAKEREILLPMRTQMLESIGVLLLDAEILRMDEKEFSDYYSKKKVEFYEEQERKEREEIVRKENEERIEREKQEAAARAVEEERNRVERERVEAERIAAEEQARKEAEEAKRIADEKAEQERVEKNSRYKAWLKQNGVVEGDDSTKVERIGDTFVLWKKVDTITIK